MGGRLSLKSRTYMLTEVLTRNLPHTATPSQKLSAMVLKIFGIFLSATTWFYGLLDFTVPYNTLSYNTTPYKLHKTVP